MSFPESEVAALAARQYGLVARRQVRDLGVTERMILNRTARGVWVPAQPSVYRVAGAPESWHQRLMAACLAGGDDTIVSHRAAATLWGFEGAWHRGVDVMSPRWLRRPRGDVELHETQDLVPDDATMLRGIPVATPHRIVLDVGCLVGPVQLEQMVVEGLRRGWFTYRQLMRRHREISRRGRNGSGRLRTVLRQMDSDGSLAQSGWEIRLAKVIVDLGFPRPVRQHRILDEDGNFVAQVDLAYPHRRLAIEADSETWHTGPTRFHRDRTRWNLIRAAGWELLVYTYQHYRHDRRHIATTLRAALGNPAQIA